MNDSTGCGHNSRWPGKVRGRAVAAIITMAGASLLAACGGSSHSPAAGGETSYQKAVAYAQCMRSHGVPSYPDPDSQGQFPPLQEGRNGVSQQAVQSAQNACRHLQPGGGQGISQQQARVTQALAFSRCMRAHGVRDFPDPSATDGGMGYNLSGVDTGSPQYQSAQRACRSQPGKGRSQTGARS